MSPLRVLFFGNHTVGVEALRTLSDHVYVAGVVAHPSDPEDGVRYDSVYEFAQKAGIPVIRGRGKNNLVHEFAANSAADLFWVTDYRYLLPTSLVSMAPLGAVNLHPSLLPRYRGRAPLNWAILQGETQLGLTAHFIADGVDEGDIILQKSFELSSDEDVGDALDNLLPLYRQITNEVIEGFVANRQVQRIPQMSDGQSAYAARRPEDGKVDWSKPAVTILNLVRAVTRPYPGAFTFLGGRKIQIWKAALSQRSLLGQPGQLIDLNGGRPVVRCGSGALEIVECSDEGSGDLMFKVGDCFGNPS